METKMAETSFSVATPGPRRLLSWWFAADAERSGLMVEADVLGTIPMARVLPAARHAAAMGGCNPAPKIVRSDRDPGDVLIDGDNRLCPACSASI
jgi:hypothetical protein